MGLRNPIAHGQERPLDTRRVLGANARIGIGLIGCGKRGHGLATHIQAIERAELRAVSDAYLPRMEQSAATAGPVARMCPDYRDLLDRKDIDAVVIATPDHWHVPMTIEAVEAGKDVYLEKPVTHSLDEGSVLVETVERSGRVVATGTQQRSWDHFLEAKRLIDRGVLGRVTYVRCHWFQNHLRSGARGSPTPDFGKLDWDRWVGPAPPQEFDIDRFRHWRFFWDFGGGTVTDLLTHWIDLVQWYMGSTGPCEVLALGKTLVHDWIETPDTVVATMEFPEGYVVGFELNLTIGLLGCGLSFRGEKAMMTLDREGYSIYEEGSMPFESVGLPRPAFRFRRPEAESFADRVDGAGTARNLRNWLACVRSQRVPNANLRAGVQAANTAHWVNKAVRTAKPIRLPENAAGPVVRATVAAADFETD